MTARVAVIPRNGLRSDRPLHSHTAGMPCLVAVERVPLTLGHIHIDEKTGEIRTPMVDVKAGWFRCTQHDDQRDPYYVHDHGHRFVSHAPRDRFAGCLA